MIEAIIVGAIVVGILAVILPPLAEAKTKRDAYRLLAEADPSEAKLRLAMDGLNRSKSPEAKRLVEDLYAKLRQTHTA